MAMIPSFLRSLATLLRRLIASGHAVHCTEADAAELEMLAGLFEQHGPVRYEAVLEENKTLRGKIVDQREVMPSDIAFGWLKLSRAQQEYGDACDERDSAQGRAIDRAAVCAELAFMSMVLLPGLGEIRNDDTPAGTIEGAREAWQFVVDYVDLAVKTNLLSGQTWTVLLDKYRRELEAMR